jgi:glutathione peroxidase-family protein
MQAKGFFDSVMEGLGMSTKPQFISPMEFYGLKPNTLEGSSFSFDQLKGKTVLITNVASRWGATDNNYKQLVTLYNKYKDQGLEILAFPCDQFGGQELANPADIRSFVDGYGVEFQMMEKSDVNGANMNSVYKTIRNGGGDILWNFATKFLVDKDGKTVTRFDGMKSPMDLEDQIVAALEA